MPASDTPFEATAESSLIVIRALADVFDTQHPTVTVAARALFAELAEQSAGLGGEHLMLASADVNCDSFYKYPSVGRVIQRTGYTDNVFVQILRDLGALKLRIAHEELGRRSIVAGRSLTFGVFDIIELYAMQNAEGRYEAPQWAVRLGQWANWLMTAEARALLGRISRAALSLDDIESFRMAVKLGEYVHFVLRAEERGKEMRVPLLNILAEVASVSVLEMRGREHEAALARILETFDAAAGALSAEGLCSVRLLRAGAGVPGAANAPVAHNDNYALLHESVVAISAAG
jgi:hypothetical protein